MEIYFFTLNRTNFLANNKIRCHSRATANHLRPCSPSKWRRGSRKRWGQSEDEKCLVLQSIAVICSPPHALPRQWEADSHPCSTSLLWSHSQLPGLIPALPTSPLLVWFSLAYTQEAILSPSVNSSGEQTSSLLASEDRESIQRKQSHRWFPWSCAAWSWRG